MIFKIILISLLSFSLNALPPYQFINLKNGVYVKNNTNRYLYCYIGPYNFNVKPRSNSRVYPHNTKKACK